MEHPKWPISCCIGSSEWWTASGLMRLGRVQLRCKTIIVHRRHDLPTTGAVAELPFVMPQRHSSPVARSLHARVWLTMIRLGRAVLERWQVRGHEAQMRHVNLFQPALPLELMNYIRTHLYHQLSKPVHPLSA